MVPEQGTATHSPITMGGDQDPVLTPSPHTTEGDFHKSLIVEMCYFTTLLLLFLKILDIQKILTNDIRETMECSGGRGAHRAETSGSGQHE